MSKTYNCIRTKSPHFEDVFYKFEHKGPYKVKIRNDYILYRLFRCRDCFRIQGHKDKIMKGKFVAF